MEQQRYFARRAFKYNGTFLHRGRVTALAGCDNDEKLPRLGLLTPLAPGQQLFRCRMCGADFISERQRTKHGDLAHAEDPVERAVAAMRDAPVMTKAQGQATVNRIMNDPEYEPSLVPDETVSTQEKENEQEAPVFFEKTAASVKAGLGAIEVTTPAPAVPAPVKATPPIPQPGTTTMPHDVVVAPPGHSTDYATAPPTAIEKPLTGKDLKKWRTKQKLSQESAGEILGVAGSSITRAEKLGKRPLGLKLAPALQKALGR